MKGSAKTFSLFTVNDLGEDMYCLYSILASVNPEIIMP